MAAVAYLRSRAAASRHDEETTPKARLRANASQQVMIGISVVLARFASAILIVQALV